MIKLIYLFIFLTLVNYGCKKPDSRTGVMLAVEGPKNYYMEVVSGIPVTEIVDIDEWRPDVVFWANVSNGFIELKEGTYTIVLKNEESQKLISIPIIVNPQEVTKATGSLK